MSRDERAQLKDLHKDRHHMDSKQKRTRPFFNGWITWSSAILLVIYCTAGVAAIIDRDLVTLSVLGGVTLLAFVVRCYQYFIQKR